MFPEAQKSEFARRGRTVQRIDLVNASHNTHLDAFEQWIGALSSFIDVR